MGSSGSTFWASLFRLATILLVGLTACELALGQNDGLDLDGKTVNPLEAASGRIVVLIFIRRDCPVSNRYAPVIRQISAQHEHDASFWLVFPDKTDTAEMIQRYLREYSYGLRAL